MALIAFAVITLIVQSPASARFDLVEVRPKTDVFRSQAKYTVKATGEVVQFDAVRSCRSLYARDMLGSAMSLSPDNFDPVSYFGHVGIFAGGTSDDHLIIVHIPFDGSRKTPTNAGFPADMLPWTLLAMNNGWQVFNVKEIQPPTAGVVGELLVRDGSRLRDNDVRVLRDDTQARTNLGIVNKQLDKLSSRQARKETERDGLDTVNISKDIADRRAEPDVERILTAETRLIAIRNAVKAGQKVPLEDEVTAGTEVQREARVAQVEGIKKELVGVPDLWNENRVLSKRVTERGASRLERERGRLILTLAQVKSEISQIAQDLQADVGKDLADIRGRMWDLLERKWAAESHSKRVEFKAALDGAFHQFRVHAVGGVITLAELAPQAAALTGGQLRPRGIKKRTKQPAALAFSAFCRRTTPKVDGTVSLASADVSQDQKTGTSSGAAA